MAVAYSVVWDPINTRQIRDELTRDSHYVYAQTPDGSDEFRIVDIKTRDGAALGRQLSTGRWRPIVAWQLR